MFPPVVGLGQSHVYQSRNQHKNDLHSPGNDRGTLFRFRIKISTSTNQRYKRTIRNCTGICNSAGHTSNCRGVSAGNTQRVCSPVTVQNEQIFYEWC